MYKIILIVTSVILFVGCALENNTPITKQNPEPKWLLDPYIENDNYAAIGCAQKHFKGVSAQKDLAISRAIDRIATQNSVTVDNITLNEKSISNGQRTSSKESSSSLHTVNNVKVSTKVKSLYTNNEDEICAWVVSK